MACWFGPAKLDVPIGEGPIVDAPIVDAPIGEGPIEGPIVDAPIDDECKPAGVCDRLAMDALATGVGATGWARGMRVGCCSYRMSGFLGGT